MGVSLFLVRESAFSGSAFCGSAFSIIGVAELLIEFTVSAVVVRVKTGVEFPGSATPICPLWTTTAPSTACGLAFAISSGIYWDHLGEGARKRKKPIAFHPS